MQERDVRFPVAEFTAFLQFNPDNREIDLLYDCLESARGDPGRGDLVPFDQYLKYPRCRVRECGRFLVVYTYDEENLEVVEILLSEDYLGD